MGVKVGDCCEIDGRTFRVVVYEEALADAYVMSDGEGNLLALNPVQTRLCSICEDNPCECGC